MSGYLYKSACAVFCDDSYSKINININDEFIELSIGDYIEFNRNGKIIQAKILNFGWNYSSKYINRIFYLPWRINENKWGEHLIPMRGIQLELHFPHNYELGDWTTIKKINTLSDFKTDTLSDFKTDNLSDFKLDALPE